MTATEKRLLGLIAETSTSLSADVVSALRRARRAETPGSHARAILDTILENVAVARKTRVPLCQDTGTLSFFVPETLRRTVTPDAIRHAVEAATAQGFLRQNTIDSVTGRSHPSNVCPGAPCIYFDDTPGTSVSLLMKGGGSENMSAQYSLPDASLGAGRDLDGVRKAVLHAVCKAQGFGCAPGILGVCIGGDRAGGFACAKRQLLRPVGAKGKNPDKALAKLEKMILEEANTLGIGPMGLGGKTTLIDVKIGALPRVPASFFVTVAYMCWALRRGSVEF